MRHTRSIEEIVPLEVDVRARYVKSSTSSMPRVQPAMMDEGY